MLKPAVCPLSLLPLAKHERKLTFMSSLMNDMFQNENNVDEMNTMGISLTHHSTYANSVFVSTTTAINSEQPEADLLDQHLADCNIHGQSRTRSSYDIAQINALAKQEHSAHNAVISRRNRTPWFMNIISLWWIEYLSIVLVLGMFGLLVITLWVYDGRALTDWPLSVSFNVVIAVESTALKSAMLLVVSEGWCIHL